MSEGTKTASFCVAAVAALAIAAVAAWPRRVSEPQASLVGQPLFEEFTDPLSAASLEIITFNEEEGRPAKFEVGKQGDSELWTIKSHGGYPADALDQMRDAATALVGLKILDVQTRNAEDHDDLGVVEPNLEKLRSGDVGIGRLVTFRDASNNRLASIVVGDTVKDDPEKRYVRIPGQDPVYVVKLDESHLTSNFRRWIEEDLLRLSSIEIGSVEIQDYLAAPGQTRFVRARNYTALIKKDGTQWKLQKLLEYDPNDEFIEPTVVEIDDTDGLNAAKLEAMANALDDLKIVDVVRKPEGMDADFTNNRNLASDKNALASLGQRGFFPQLSTDGGVEIYSANGELHVTLNDGVRYILRFGNIAGLARSDEGEGEQQDAAFTETGVNRYLLVTTEVDESMFPIPEMRSIPNTVDELKQMLGVEATAEGEDPATKDPATDEPASDEPAADESAADESATESEVEGDSEQSDDASSVDGNNSEEASGAQDRLTDEEWQERLEAEQEKITKENRRIMDERKDKLATARERVRELNSRFADWYYVIPEETYTQLRVKRDELLESGAAGDDSLKVAPKFDFPGL